MTALNAKPMQLKSGRWGAKVQGTTTTLGDLILVTTREGKTWHAMVCKVHWTGPDSRDEGKPISIVSYDSLPENHPLYVARPPREPKPKKTRKTKPAPTPDTTMATSYLASPPPVQVQARPSDMAALDLIF